MVRLRNLSPESMTDFRQLARIRPGGLEDWMLAWKSAVVFSTGGSLCALILAWAIPAFRGAGFVSAYAFFATATAGFALLIVGRTATLIKFEVGPRFLDIPRLPKLFRWAATLALPCLLLQICYPLKIVLGQLQLTTIDIKSTQDLVRLYNETGKNADISFPVVKVQDDRTVDPSKFREIIKDQIQKERTLLDDSNDVYDRITDMISRFPALGGGLDVHLEQSRLKDVINERIRILSDMNPQSINESIKSEVDQIKTDLESWRGYAWAEGEYARKLAALDTEYTQSLDRGHNMQGLSRTSGCSSSENTFACQLLYRLHQLSGLRDRSFGTPLNIHSSLTSDFRSALYLLLFGWQGVPPILTIAATFGILLRIQRLTDVQWPYVTAAIGIVGIVIWGGFEVYSLPLLVVALMLWLIAMLIVGLSYRAPAMAKKGSFRGISVRLAMLALPTILLLPLSVWQLAIPTYWLIWPLAVGLTFGLGFLIRQLDNLMLEGNCRPRIP